MALTLPPLPYAYDALAPFMSKEMRAKRDLGRPPSREPRDTLVYDSFEQALAQEKFTA